MERQDDTEENDGEWLYAATRDIEESLRALERSHPARAREWRGLLIARLAEVAAERTRHRARTRRGTTSQD